MKKKIDEEACDCPRFIPKDGRPHQCFECGGTERVVTFEDVKAQMLRDVCDPPRPQRNEYVLPDGIQKAEWRNDHRAACTCMSCIMRRIYR